jgi:hypothetical protein
MERKDGTNYASWAGEWHLGHCTNQTDTDWIVSYPANWGLWMTVDPNRIRYSAPITSAVHWYKPHTQVEDATPPTITLCISGRVQATDVQNSWVWIDN